MQLSPFDPSTIYIGANLVLKSTDRGRSYQPISPDLTTNTDREALSIMGVVGKDIQLAKHDGVGSFGNIVTLEESAAKQGVVWTGSDDGVVSVTQDAGKTWTNVTSKISGVPKWTYVSDVLPSRFAGRHRLRHLRRPSRRRLRHLRVRDHRLRRDLAIDRRQPAEGRGRAHDRRGPEERRPALSRHRNRPLGLVESRRQWTRLKANLPTMPIYEIKLHPRDNDLILATHARGIWILDDLTPIQQWAKAEAADAFVFDASRPSIINAANDQMKGFEGDRVFLGPNPAPGATLAYRAEGRREGRQVDDQGRARGDVVREMSRPGRCAIATRPGLNIVKWDLRDAAAAAAAAGAGARRAPAAAGRGGGFGGGGNNGPFVLPGTYRPRCPSTAATRRRSTSP